MFQREGHSSITLRTTDHETTRWQKISGLKECRPCRHPDPYQQHCPLTITLLNPHTPGVGTHSFEGISPLWSPLPDKAIKLFFSTLPKTLSLRFNSVPVYRGWISAASSVPKTCLHTLSSQAPSCDWGSLARSVFRFTARPSQVSYALITILQVFCLHIYLSLSLTLPKLCIP